MSFNYHKQKQDDQGHFWASYSDLLLGLSVVFLLLYVTASIRSGASGLHAQAKNQKLNREVQDLKNQLKAYSNIKDEYISTHASQEEQQEYIELLDKITLLEEEAKEEKKTLEKSMLEQSKKEKALNQYQQMVRNIINANALAKKKVMDRNQLINNQDQEILNSKKEIEALENQISQKEKQIEINKKILLSNINNLKEEVKKNQLSQKSYAEKLNQLKQKSAEEISMLQAGVSQYRAQLQETQYSVQKISKALSESESNLNKSQSKIKGMEQSQMQAQEKINQLESEINARKKVAEDIKQAFNKKGIAADINQNGDVILDFGEHHFDSDSSNLKKGMVNILEKAMPEYAKALLGNPKLANKVTSIDIIGFASPTFKGRFIDPKSEVDKDREALAYNMDLSYRRAKSIYNYSFQNKNINFDYQKKMLPLVKISARSYLDMFDEKRRPTDFEKFCKSNDCTKARKVMIKFSMETEK